jgi:sugar phosphate permease
MRSTGPFNVAQGAVATAQGIGAALSTALAGIVVMKVGYSAAFLTLGAIAAMGILVFGLALPTASAKARRSQQ